MPTEGSSSPIQTRASWSQVKLINICRGKDRGPEKSMTWLNIQLASDRASKLGICLRAPTCQKNPSGNWIRSLHHRLWEHLSAYTEQSFILFRSPTKSSLSVKSGSISLHSLACHTESKKNAARAKNCHPGSRTCVLPVSRVSLLCLRFPDIKIISSSETWLLPLFLFSPETFYLNILYNFKCY